VLFTDEAAFTNHGNVNLHNMHFWAMENPHWLRQVEHQRQWSLNVWCGIIDDKIIGPYFIDGHLNGNSYANLLEHTLGPLLEDLPLITRRTMCNISTMDAQLIFHWLREINSMKNLQIAGLDVGVV
jgi:hypothetical protein